MKPKNGMRARLTLKHGDIERVVEGEIRSFTPEDDAIAILEAQLAALKKANETRWEVVTGDERHPAVGFLPEHVVSIEEL